MLHVEHLARYGRGPEEEKMWCSSTYCQTYSRKSQPLRIPGEKNIHGIQSRFSSLSSGRFAPGAFAALPGKNLNDTWNPLIRLIIRFIIYIYIHGRIWIPDTWNLLNFHPIMECFFQHVILSLFLGSPQEVLDKSLKQPGVPSCFLCSDPGFEAQSWLS